MEPKRELTSVDLAALVSELSAYRGATVDKAYLYGDDLLRLKLRDHDRGRLELLVEVGDVKRVHLADPEHVPEAPGRPPDFAMKLRSRIAGGDLAEVSQYEFDRILRFRFSRPDGDTAMVVELFGDGNVAVLDPTDRVLDSLETVRLKSRTVVPGAQYEYPASRVNPLRLSRDGFAAHMDDSDTDLVRTLATQLNFGGLYAEELCTRAGVEKTRPIAEATDEDYDALYAEVGALEADLAGGAFEPRVYYEGGGDEPDGSGDGGEGGARSPVDVTPFPLEEREAEDLESEPYDTFDAALDAYFFALEREAEVGDEGPDFEERIAKQQRIVDQQESAIERFADEAAREREKAE
ncbi:MAG TPA: NFACT family protein, partial [Halobacteriales archaeon]|nr:NFACT family protein [Halobacteriales archaeon]